MRPLSCIPCGACVDGTTRAPIRIGPCSTHSVHAVDLTTTFNAHNYREQLAGIQYATETPRQPKVWDKLAKNLQGLSLPPGALNMNMNMNIRGLKNVFTTNKRGAAVATAAGEA